MGQTWENGTSLYGTFGWPGQDRLKLLFLWCMSLTVTAEDYQYFLSEVAFVPINLQSTFSLLKEIVSS